VKKGRHIYLICRDPADPGRKLFIPEAKILDQIKAVFSSIHIPPKLLNAQLSCPLSRGRARVSRSAAADRAGRRIDAQGRRQDLKTPVEQALMRGLDTA